MAMSHAGDSDSTANGKSITLNGRRTAGGCQLSAGVCALQLAFGSLEDNVDNMINPNL